MLRCLPDAWGKGLYGSPARARIEEEAEQRSSASVVIASILALLVVAVAVAAVAYLVLREPTTAVDSAERLEPVGTALPAPTEPALPTPTSVPTEEPAAEPTAANFSGSAPAVAGLPTVAAVVDAGPTPTPRIIAQPTDVPPTPLPPAPTLPPVVAVTAVPVVALQPVEQAPPVATSPPVQSNAPQQAPPTPTPGRDDSDPFDIFDTPNDSRIVQVTEDPLERVRAMQEERGNDPGEATVPDFPNRIKDKDDREVDAPVMMPTVTVGNGGAVEVQVPDVDAMIDEITARTLDPNRNPNVADDGRRVTDANGDDAEDSDTANGKKKSARERINERKKRKTPTPQEGSGNSNLPNMPNMPGNDGQPGQNGGECRDPFANLPEEQRPTNFPFNDCD